MNRHVQYGCGLDAPKEWVNYDTSPTLRIQKIPILGSIIKSKLNTVFPDNVKHGDIILGLPEKENSCDGLYCSHTLEHLALNDLRIALINSYKIIKPSGIFRLVVPDIEFLARDYIHSLDSGNENAALNFIGSTLMGKEHRANTLKQKISELWGNSHHLWMWDYVSMSLELKKAGFIQIRRCNFNDSTDQMFSFVERESRFINALAIEAIK